MTYDRVAAMAYSLLVAKRMKDNYFLVPTEYIEGDEFEIDYLLGRRPIITRHRTDGTGFATRNTLYYDPTLFWAIPVDLHNKKLTVVGILSKLEEFKELKKEFTDSDYLIIKVD